jgi:NAD+ synthase
MRLSVSVARVAESGLPLVYLNQVGGQDELVFDGASFALNADRSLAAQLPAFEENITTLRWIKGANGWHCNGPIAPVLDGDEGDYAACVLGLRDYVGKNGFPGVLMGLSGGIDSALCAAIAVDALGADRLRGVMLPFKYTAQVSLDDAEKLAKALGFRYEILPIADAVNGFEAILSETFKGLPRDITEENLQARARGTLLMAISNKTGAMVVTTGNKSEMSVGYATLYGDMNGGFNPIKDLFKMEVYRLAAWRNAHVPDGSLCPHGDVIPQAIIDKAPSAELRPDQKDQDSLPPYPILDEVLTGLIEDELSVAEIVEKGQGRFDRALVKRVERLVLLAEYKRRQAAPGVKLTKKAFGIGRKYPITNGYRDDSDIVLREPAPARQGVQ